MIKRLALLSRRDDLSMAEYLQYWRGAHADLVKTVPRLARYRQNAVLQRLGPAAPRDGVYDLDGFAELWFASQDDMQAALASPAGRALPGDEKAFLSEITILAVCERVVRASDEGAKVLVLVGGTAPERADEIACEFEALCATDGLSGLTGCSVDRVLEAFSSPDLRTEPVPPSTVIVLRFQSAANAERLFQSLSAARFFDREASGSWFVAYLVEETPIC